MVNYVTGGGGPVCVLGFVECNVIFATTRLTFGFGGRVCEATAAWLGSQRNWWGKVGAYLPPASHTSQCQF